MMKHPLEELATFPIELIWHENKTVYITVIKEPRKVLVRLHRLFYDAPTPVLEALLRYASGRDRQAKAVIRQMAHLHFSKERGARKELKSRGNTYDLQAIFQGVQKWIPVTDVAIGWSERKGRGKFHSITFGAYDCHARQIRINPILDDPEVPLYFLEYIVYHEVLHALCPSKMDQEGRCSVHTREFREKERQFFKYKEAKEWEKQSLTFFKKKGRSHGRS